MPLAYIVLKCFILKIVVFQLFTYIVSFSEYWLGIRTEFLIISEMALNILLQSYVTFLCDMILLALIHIKSKYQLILKNVENEMSTIQSRFNSLC